jgi:hypothetical protein
LQPRYGRVIAHSAIGRDVDGQRDGLRIRAGVRQSWRGEEQGADARNDIDRLMLRDETQRELWNLLLRESDGGSEAHFYVCGSTRVAKTVRTALEQIIARFHRDAEGHALPVDEFLYSLAGQGRYQTDVFTSFAPPPKSLEVRGPGKVVSGSSGSGSSGKTGSGNGNGADMGGVGTDVRPRVAAGTSSSASTTASNHRAGQAASAAADVKYIHRSTVFQHGGANKSAWIIIDGKVYDISSYIYLHPGGAKLLQGLVGLDATRNWRIVGHHLNSEAGALLSMHQIGFVMPLRWDDAECTVPGLAGMYDYVCDLAKTVVESENVLATDFALLSRRVSRFEATAELSRAKAELLIGTHQRFVTGVISVIAGVQLHPLCILAWAMSPPHKRHALGMAVIRRLDAIRRSDDGRFVHKSLDALAKMDAFLDDATSMDDASAIKTHLLRFVTGARDHDLALLAAWRGAILSVLDALELFHDGNCDAGELARRLEVAVLRLPIALARYYRNLRAHIIDIGTDADTDGGDLDFGGGMGGGGGGGGRGGSLEISAAGAAMLESAAAALASGRLTPEHAAAARSHNWHHADSDKGSFFTAFTDQLAADVLAESTERYTWRGKCTAVFNALVRVAKMGALSLLPDISSGIVE